MSVTQNSEKTNNGEKKMENGKQMTSAERRAERDLRIERKVERAKSPDTLVLKIKTKRVNMLANLLPQTDAILTRVQDRVGEEISFGDAEKIFDEYREIVLKVEEFTEKLSTVCGMKYIESAGLHALKKRLEDVPKAAAKRNR